MDKWLTINELAERTGIPDSTIRRYIAKFSDFFVVQGGTRSKRYDNTALQLLIRIKELYDKGYETEQTFSTLAKEFPLVINEAPPEEIAQPPALATADDIIEIKKMLYAQQELSNRLLDKIAQQDEYIKNSLERRDRELMKALTTSKDNEADKRQPFWRRFFN